MRHALARMRWLSRRAATSLGLQGVAGCALLAFSLAFYFSAVAPVERELAQARAQALSFKDRVRQWEKIGANPLRDRHAQLVAFVRFFPPLETFPDWLSKIYAAAEREKIELAEGEYRLVEDKALRLAHYEISLPVKASYTQIRKFLSATLAEVPPLSLDNVSFQRQKIGETELQVEIKFTLHLGRN